MDFFEHQEAARRKTKLLVFYFLSAVILIVVALNFALWGLFNLSGFSSNAEGQGIPLSQWFTESWFYIITFGSLALIILGSLYRWITLRGGGRSVAQMVNAREILPDTNDLQERQLLNVVEEMSIASGTAVPTVYVMDQEDAINAFVAGIETADTVMVVTRGALEQLSRQELQGVVAHEFSHIFNADMRINVRLISILAGILILGQAGYFIMRAFRYGGRTRSSKESGGIVVAIILIGVSIYAIGSIGLFFGRLIKAAISRQREYLADASAVQYSRDNEGLAGAFIKIKHQGSLLSNSHAEETSHMCISEPIKLSFNSLATHPPIENRLEAIMPGWENMETQFIEEQQRKKEQATAPKEEASSNNKNGVFDIGGLADTIGKPTNLHMHAAGALLLALPDLIKNAAHGSHSSNSAINLVFALLLSDHGQVEQNSLDSISQVYGEQSSDKILELASSITRDQRQLRLAILDLAMPSLRRLSKAESQQFFRLLRKLIHQDQHVSPFEYVLYCLIHKNLIGREQQGSKSITRFNKVDEELQVLLSTVIHSSGQEMENKKAVFRQVFDGMISSERELLEKDFNAEQFHQALNKLRRLSPMLKKPLLNGLEEAIKQDGVIRHQELELLRAIAECLDCPIPPIIEESQKEAIESANKHLNKA
ncbi:M48 family metallopeptidase [Kangiella sediminilitoris]|uniref:Peptidase M48 Ste24p n=1 Tax=Kangiella sediminilitoris TaxID=1144748 RepID=A0A1B3B8Q9_9GAMM|nr:M48 family metallopeptidase [Kangiella sediminilitoris]AOE49165.1 Peptidase M48 Ste24p [Kangiella sediminilitoris]